MKKSGLGRGFDSLFMDNEIETSDQQKENLKVRLSDVEPNKAQPRKYFDKEKLEELASSIREHGLLQPIIVRKIDDKYQIISGERRWRACRMAGLAEVPVIIKDLDEKQVLEIGLIENLQREDLNGVEEAEGYRSLIDDFGLTQEEVAKRVGKSRPAVANALRILALPKEVLALVSSGKLSSGHARALLPLTKICDEAKIIEIANDVVEKDITVRELENLAKRLEKSSEPKEKPKKASGEADIYFKQIAEDLSNAWGRKVKISSSSKDGKVKGTVEFEFYDNEDFNNLLDIIQKKR
ncbi:MAG: ParB/RepB/Spo0J family partition protein [Clostridia bacterium]|nr:ParB/RepB/Spo0J family partition protein [Clostridia bacterium]